MSLDAPEAGFTQQASDGVTPEYERIRAMALRERVMTLLREAVAYAHSRGVLHWDLKSSNILWDADAGSQLTDFERAKLLGTPDGAVPLVANALGSPSYMAPEQAGGWLTEISRATDVYGLGAVLYELLSGRPPFAGASPVETMRRAA